MKADMKYDGSLNHFKSAAVGCYSISTAYFLFVELLRGKEA